MPLVDALFLFQSASETEAVCIMGQPWSPNGSWLFLDR